MEFMTHENIDIVCQKRHSGLQWLQEKWENNRNLEHSLKVRPDICSSNVVIKGRRLSKILSRFSVWESEKTLVTRPYLIT